MDHNAIRKSYKRYAKGYDFYFGALFQPGRKAVIKGMNCQSGDHVLEVGIGTGLSLLLYPPETRVTGIDLSSHMLEQAQVRKQRGALSQVALAEMDAEQMAFADNSFDKVVAMYVASVVPHPERLVQEMRRVCKPGGELYIVNHFHSSNPLLARLEKLVAPLSKVIGFHPDFPLDAFVRETELDVQDRIPVNILGYWTLLRATNNKVSVADVMPREAPVHVAAS